MYITEYVIYYLYKSIYSCIRLKGTNIQHSEHMGQHFSN